MRRALIAVLACLLCLGASAAAVAGAKSGTTPAAVSGKAAKPTAKQRAKARARASARWRAELKKQVKACKRKRYARRHKTLCKGLRGARGPKGPAGPAGPAGPQGPGAPGRADQQLRLLAINDLHGYLEPPSGRDGTVPTGPNGATTAVGGAAYLATHLKRLEAGVPHAMFVGGGDLIGASPLISGLFHDEPTVEALNAMDMDYSGVGNHEFDEGSAELLRMQFGGCHPTDGCQDGDGFVGALYRWLAANVRRAGTDDTILPPYKIKTVGGIKVAFIGMTLEGTPNVVTPAGVAGLQFDEESATVNRLVRDLSDSEGVESFVVLLHQGGTQNPPYAKGFQDVSGCENRSGDIWPIVDRMSKKVDVVVSAHTHNAYVCEEDGKLVTSAASFGRLITRIDLTLDGATGDVKAKTAANELVTRDVPADGAVQSIIDKYSALATPVANRVVGETTAPSITRTPDADGEIPLGNVIADSQLAATAGSEAQIAFMNPGGIRSDLVGTGGAGPNGGTNVTFKNLYDVQPFANTLVVKTFTGAQIKALLAQQFNNPSAGSNRILQVSQGFTYSYAGTTVDPASVKLNGTTITDGGTYKVAMNSFLATGGDGFTVFNQGTGQVGGDVDIDAAVAYFQAHRPLATPATNRITKTG